MYISIYIYIYICPSICIGTAAETDDLIVTSLDASGKLLVWQLLVSIYLYLYIISIHPFKYSSTGAAADTDDWIVSSLDASGKLIVWQLHMYLSIYLYLYIHR